MRAFLLAFCSIALLLLRLSAAASQNDLVNTHVKRLIDVSGAQIVTRSTIAMKNTASDSITHFLISLHPDTAPHVHDLWITLPNAPEQALPHETLPDNTHGTATFIRVTLPHALKSQASITVDVRMDISAGLVPMPAEISAHDSQYMLYEGVVDFYSPYHTDVGETVVILGSSSITSHSDFPTPSSISGKRITLGPYENVGQFTHRQVSIRFLNNRGFLIGTSVTKTLDVTHWRTASVTEEYEVRNGAATHRGEWSRIDHSHRYPSAYTSAVGDVWANLPRDADHVVYRDLIGNVTSSRLRKAAKDKRAVQLTFRYPLMGGWKNHFWIIYNLLHKNHVSSDEALMHVITVPIWPSVHADLLCEDLTVKIILPEWADDITIDEHPSVKMAQEIVKERVSFALVKRPVVKLRMRMVRSQAKHKRVVVVRYRYNGMMKWISPVVYAMVSLVVVVVSLAFFLSGLEAAVGGSTGSVDLNIKKVQ